ncbi:TraI/MobA(P) family conjugative relaxase [Methyloterricola oryzae]|uniref:TraI/MobA(P) family conjugative relaxase n=1 Tax=Methyloterricola oryzae TaxID=1495050 RepID=UPI0005EBCD3B|nr:TraI/MobA(P) family conjugative relaxase [Methyloterricola oryzae]
MIAKHVPMRTVRKSDFAGLVKYICDPQEKRERVDGVSVTNCYSDDPSKAILEVTHTQSRNIRSSADKTYHLIVSFRAGENPSADALRAIEARICEGLGFGEHQRVSALHTDTDNVHLHIAINKVHPSKLTVLTPYNDYKVLGDLCKSLERDYCLEPDNHQSRKSGSENRAADMERHAGVESLLGWIQRECLADLNEVRDWSAFNSVLNSHGLRLMVRGNGFVFTDGAGTYVKGSSVSREFSKAKLEARFGSFQQEKTARKAQAQRRYEPRPVKIHVDTTELYARYIAEQRLTSAARAQASAEVRDRRHRLIQTAKRTAKLKRAVIKLVGGSAQSKRLLYALVSKSLRDNIAHINQKCRTDKESVHRLHRRMTWADWLRAEAIQGDRHALVALRAREAAQSSLKGNTVAGTGQQAQSADAAEVMQDSITKKGTAIYVAGHTTIRDDGTRIQVSRELSQRTASTALKMAMERYGTHLAINGTEQFKDLLVQAAAETKLPITFDDPELEQRRQALMKQPQPQNSAHGQRGGVPWNGQPRRTHEQPAIDPAAWTAADSYILEQNRNRLYFIDIPEHDRYSDKHGAVMIYGGLRTVKGQLLALLQKDTHVYVLPVDESTASQLRRKLVGTTVTFVNGAVQQQTKGRAR